MNVFIKLVAALAITASVFLTGTVLGIQKGTPAPSFGASSFTPVGGQTYTLSGAGVTATQTTVSLTSFTTPDGRAITMAMVGSIGYGTLEPNTSSKIEDITFSGITQNVNGTATLTGVTRGNDFVTPYAATPSLAKAHAGGSYFILSNTAGFYGQQFLFANNAGSSTATITYSNTAPPFYYPGPGVQSTGSAISTTSEFASIAYVNAVTTSGAPNASTAAKGIVQLATAAQTAVGTLNGSTGAALVPQNAIFSSTQSATTLVPVTNASGKLAQGFLDLTQAFTVTGQWIFNTFTPQFSVGFLSQASSTISATTTIAASSVLNKALVLNGVAYQFPTSQTASTTFLSTDNGGKLTWELSSTGVVSTTTTFVASNGTIGSGVSKTVFCVAPKVVSGGGFSGLTPISGGATLGNVVTGSFPVSASAWEVDTKCSGTGGGSCVGETVTIYALCVNP